MTARSPWPALAVLGPAVFLVLLDTTIVNAALPDLQRGLSASVGQALWVLNAYLLASAALLAVFGRTTRLLGPRVSFAGGLGLFTLASALCGHADSAGELIGARLVQGAGAAALLPPAVTLLAAGVPTHRRGTALGLGAAALGAAPVLGLLAGGPLAAEFGWQAIFNLNVPIGVAALVLVPWLLPSAGSASAGRLDPLSLLLAVAGLAGVTYGLTSGQHHGWGPVLGPITVPMIMVVAVGLLAAAVRRGLVDPALLRDRRRAGAVLTAFLGAFALAALLPVLVSQSRAVLGLGPLTSGLAVLPWAMVLGAAAFALPPLILRRWAAATLDIARQVGALLGVAVAAAVLQHRYAVVLDREFMQRVTQLPDAARAPFLASLETAGLALDGAPTVLAPTALPPGAAQQLRQLTDEALTSALSQAGQLTLLTLLAIVTAMAVLGAGTLALLTRPRATEPAPPALPVLADRH